MAPRNNLRLLAYIALYLTAGSLLATAPAAAESNAPTLGVAHRVTSKAMAIAELEQLAKRAEADGNSHQAIRRYAAIIELKPESPSAYLNQARLRLSLGQAPHVLRLYRQVAKLRRLAPQQREELARLALANLSPADAAALIRRLFHPGRQTSILPLLAAAYERGGAYSASLSVWRQLRRERALLAGASIARLRRYAGPLDPAAVSDSDWVRSSLHRVESER